MAVKLMRWRPWSPPSSKEYEVKMIVHHIKGLDCLIEENIGNAAEDLQEYARLAIEIKWKGSKGGNTFSLSSFRTSVRRNFTKEEPLRDDGVVEWNEEFFCACKFRTCKDASFYPWEVAFTFLNGSNRLQNGEAAVLACGTLNLSDLCFEAQQEHIEVSVPLHISRFNNQAKCLLNLSLSLLESKSTRKSFDVMQRPIVPITQSPRLTEKNELSIIKGLGKLRLLKGFCVRRTKKDRREEKCTDGKRSVRNKDVECIYPLESDSLDDMDEEESAAEKESQARKSLTYGTLAYANHAAQFSYCTSSSSEDEDFIYYSHRKRNPENCHVVESPKSVLNQSSWHSPIRGILPWRKTKLSHGPNVVKGEPLLKKQYGEGGDDIDFDRRLLNTMDESTFELCKAEEESKQRSSVSQFGDEIFTVGSWEQKDFSSRDGQKKLQTEVFFASIDQRNEQAAGESACTALVAVITNWFHFNKDQLPIKSQLDSLIREGSLEWRNLCENEIYMELFPDKHFDLETVMQANIRPISVVPEKSFIGFFHPEGIEDEGFDFLKGAMSFDNIWDEISRFFVEGSLNSGHHFIYIISWNDHFFVLRVDHDAYYIIDTLGERLFEGCNQAFILKFDRNTTIHQVTPETAKADNKIAVDKVDRIDTKEAVVEGEIVIRNEEETGGVVCRGKECCKEYIKSFLAEIPIRELQVDLKKGLMPPTQLHRRLQIEFHYTKCLTPESDSCSRDAIPDNEVVLALADRVSVS